MTGITKLYPGTKALDDVSIAFSAGEVHAIIGENGAGKSTLIKVLSGAVQPQSGTIEFNGVRFAHMDPHLAIQSGIAVVHQELMQFNSLSVADNICMADSPKGKLFVNQKWRRQRALQLLETFDASISPDALVRDLSVANRQIVEIAKAINQNARVVIMDEPTASITVQEQVKLFELIRRLREQNLIVIYISHRLEELFEICDRVTVLRDAQKIATCPISQLDTQKMIALMVGRSIETLYVDKPPRKENVVLHAENLSGNGVQNISFALHEGEILGFAGLVGAGRTELMELVFGAARLETGSISIRGKPVKLANPTAAIAHGLGFITEDRKHTGLFLDKTITWNITIITAKEFSRLLLTSARAEHREAERYQKSLAIKAPNLDAEVASLSGGNQQKVVLAKVLSADSDIIIFDEPTRGVDVGARSEIYGLMVELTKQGKSILMVTSDMEELIGMSERIVVLHEGRKMGELEKSEFSQNRIMELASGYS